MRSLYTRLNDRGKTGPRSLKPFEAVYQLGQMEKNGFNWRSDELSLDALIQETLEQVSRQSNGIKKYLGMSNLICQSCNSIRGFLEENITRIDTSNMSYPISMTDIFNNCIKRKKDCACKNSTPVADSTLKMVIVSFSSPVNIDLSPEIIHFGRKWMYKSHVQESSSLPTSYFTNNNSLMFQDQNGKILKESFGFHAGVKIVAFACSSKFEEDDLIIPAYDEKVQKILRKQYNSVVNPELNEQNQQKTKLYEQNRAKEENRLQAKRKHDQIRDKIRDKDEPRLEQKRKHDQIRDKEEPRLEQKKKTGSNKR